MGSRRTITLVSDQQSRRPTYTTRAGERKSAVAHIVAILMAGVVAYLGNAWLAGTWLTETGLFLAAVTLMWALVMWHRYRPKDHKADPGR